jgi:hypothetical protein
MNWKRYRTKYFGAMQDTLPEFARRDRHNTQNVGVGRMVTFRKPNFCAACWVLLPLACYNTLKTRVCENVVVYIFILTYLTLFQISQYSMSVSGKGMSVLNNECNILLQEVSAKSKPTKSWTCSIINSFTH